MFNKPTVLIIGAGASAEFDMPLGSQLIQRVANAVTPGTHWADNPEKGLLLGQMQACLGDAEAKRLFDLGPRLTAVIDGAKLPYLAKFTAIRLASSFVSNFAV